MALSIQLVKAQTDANERGNLPFYYNETWHFGMALGINYASFFIQPVAHFERLDSLKAVTTETGSGFNLGFVFERRLHKYLTIRFLPTYCFTSRSLNFYFEGKKDNISRVKIIESSILYFPIELKLRSRRVKNFSAYILTGGGFCRDLASKRNVDNTGITINEQIVKLKRDDFFCTAGSGAEFYLKYIKLALEVKVSMGLRNMLVKDNTIFASSIDKLKSKIVMISLTLER